MNLHFSFVVIVLGRRRGWSKKSQSGAFGSSSLSVLLVWSRRAHPICVPEIQMMHSESELCDHD